MLKYFTAVRLHWFRIACDTTTHTHTGAKSNRIKKYTCNLTRTREVSQRPTGKNKAQQSD